MKIAYRLFGKKFRKKKAEYIDLDKMLKAARIDKTYDAYLADAKFYSIIAAIIGIVVGFISYSLIHIFILKLLEKLTHTYKPNMQGVGVSSYVHIPIHIPIKINKPSFSIPGLSIKVPINLNIFVYIIEIFIILGISLLFYYIVYAIYMLYPSIKADERKREIERMLPHAVNYMYSLSKGGIGIIDIIYSLSRHKNVYGEVAEEFRFIVNQMEYFGSDLHSAITELYEITPSDTLREFISGLLTTIDSGGNLTVFLAQKSEQYVEKAKTEQKNFLEMLGLLAESYVTIAVTAPLFIIIIQSTMLAIGSGDIRSLYGVVYIFMPLSSLFFAIIIYIMTPKDVRRVTTIELNDEEYSTKNKKDENDKKDVRSLENSKIYSSFKKAKIRKKRIEALKSPIKLIKQNPIYVLFVSIPLSVFYIISSIKSLRPDFVVTSAMLIALTPLSILYELKRRRENKIKSQIPEFLKNLAGIIATGTTLQKAISIVAESGEGGLYDELKRIKRSIEWGAEIVESFAELANRIKVPLLTRVVVVLMDVIRIGGDLAEALHLCGKDAELDRKLNKERELNLLIYIIIMYVSFFTFLGVMVMLSTQVFPMLFKSAVKTNSLPFFRHSVNKNQMMWILSQATIIQAFFSGIVSGVMAEGDPIAGVKHSVIMILCVMGVLLFLS